MSEPSVVTTSGVSAGPAAAPTLSFPLLWGGLLGLSALVAWLSPVMGTVEGTAEGGRGVFLPALTFLICLLAAWFDAATDRIPNALTYPAVLLGLALNLAGAGLPAMAGTWLGGVGAVEALKGLGVCSVVGLGLLMFAPVGGDAKLMMALGALAGFHQASAALLWALAVAVPFALANLALRGRVNGALRYLTLHLLSWVYLHRPAPVEPPSKATIPLAMPILGGLILAELLPGVMM